MATNESEGEKSFIQLDLKNTFKIYKLNMRIKAVLSQVKEKHL